MTFSDPRDRRRRLAAFELEGRAMSGSGVEKGRHIIDPRTGRPVEDSVAAWACAGDGATADALSTAFMIMSDEEIRSYCAAHDDVLGLVIVEEPVDGRTHRRIRHYGPWKHGQLPACD